jgi:hypothetical protein
MIAFDQLATQGKTEKMADTRVLVGVPTPSAIGAWSDCS